MECYLRIEGVNLDAVLFDTPQSVLSHNTINSIMGTWKRVQQYANS